MKVVLASTFEKSFRKIAPLVEREGINTALCITTAANVYPPNQRDWQAREMQCLEDLGISLDMFDLAGETRDTVATKLAAYRAVYVTGGNTFYLLQQMQKSGAIDLLKSWAGAEEKVYLGASAGAVIACANIAYIRDMEGVDGLELVTLATYDGLGFFDKLVVPHADHDAYGSVADQIVAELTAENRAMLALNDDQVVVWDGVQQQLL